MVLHGDTFDEAYAKARELEAAGGLTFVHPFDDPDVIAGQGTVGMEILRQHPDPIEAIFVPIGGGGLASGVAAFVKFLSPETKVIGVEPVDAACMAAAVAAGELVTLNQVDLFADGVAVRRAGEETFRLCRDLLDEIITVDIDGCARRSRTSSMIRAPSPSRRARWPRGIENLRRAQGCATPAA